MKFLDLRFFILFMWGIVMLACISIIFIISPMSKHLIHEKNSINNLNLSKNQIKLNEFIELINEISNNENNNKIEELSVNEIEIENENDEK